MEAGSRVLATATPRLEKMTGHKLAMLPGDKVVEDMAENHGRSMSKRLVQRIGEILSRFDVVAIQEVKANIWALRDTLKVLGPHWGLILTDVTQGNASNDERMAFIFDTRRVQLSGLACELVVPMERLKDISLDALREQFARTPYAVGFRSGKKTFILVTLHILFGDKVNQRIPELKAIAKWMADWAKDVNGYDQNLIALGDFNIDARGDLLSQTFF